MGLRNLTFPSQEVRTPGGSFAVRGLSSDHVLGLFYRHREAVTKFFGMVVENVAGGQPISPLIVEHLIIQALVVAPQVVAEIIAVAEGSDPKNVEEFVADVAVARLLPLSIQMEALEKIASQTFSSDMPPGKMLALLVKAMQAGSSAAKSLPDL